METSHCLQRFATFTALLTRRSVSNVALWAFAGLLAGCANKHVDPAAAPSPVLPHGRLRVAEADLSKTLQQQLQPGDEVVHLLNSSYSDVDATQTRKEALLRAVSFADEILSIEVSEAKPELIRTGSWIRTVFRSRVLAVFKGNATARKGDERRFIIGGGLMKIDDVMVQVLRPVPYVKGGRYLVFFGAKEAGGEDLSPLFGAMPLLLRGDSFSAYPGFSDELDGITVTDLREAIAEVDGQAN